MKRFEKVLFPLDENDDTECPEIIFCEEIN